jgi:AraC-like DNA-binding protein
LALPLVTPGLGAELFFHHGLAPRLERAGSREQLDRAHLLCVRDTPLRLLEQADVGFTVVRLRAGALGRFTRIPLRELKDTQLSVQELWGRAGAELASRVAEAKSFEARTRLLEEFLLCRMAETSFDPLLERTIGMLYRDPAAVVVESLARQCGLSRRQLERRVTTYFGQSPVELRCLARFFHAVRQLMLEPSTDTLSRALDLGYYDQSHFIREFKRFAGMPPESFRRATAELTHFYNPPRTPLARLSFPSRSTDHDSATRRAARSPAPSGRGSHHTPRPVGAGG